MAVDRTSFLISFPEFTNAATALIDAKIVDAKTAIDSTELESRYDEAVELWTAHSLALSPDGQELRLSKTAVTLYETRLNSLLHSAGITGDLFD